jgi:hypothetical protein
VCAFEQAAEIFFAGNVLGAFLVAEIWHGFVFHFEPFETHDADVFLALFPDLALAQFHGDVVLAGNLSLLVFVSGETAGNGRLFFIAGGLFGGDCGAFLLAGAAGFGLFLIRFLLVRLWRSIAHDI